MTDDQEVVSLNPSTGYFNINLISKFAPFEKTVIT